MMGGMLRDTVRESPLTPCPTCSRPSVRPGAPRICLSCGHALTEAELAADDETRSAGRRRPLLDWRLGQA